MGERAPFYWLVTELSSDVSKSLCLERGWEFKSKVTLAQEKGRADYRGGRLGGTCLRRRRGRQAVGTMAQVVEQFVNRLIQGAHEGEEAVESLQQQLTAFFQRFLCAFYCSQTRCHLKTQKFS
jgi:hypothetical protein